MESYVPCPEETANNLRTEYSELSRYFIAVIAFRFTVLGLFTAGQLAVLVNARLHVRLLFLLAAVLTFAFYVIELRNRIVYSQIIQRGAEIEKHPCFCLESSEPRYFGGMFSSDRPGFIYIFGKKFNLDIKFRKFITHSVGVDMVYGTFLIADLLVAIFGRQLHLLLPN